MSSETKRRCAAGGVFWALLAFWLSADAPARAQVRPAAQPIVNGRLQRVVDMIPNAATDLPPYLVKPQDVYLLVTAGASYTDIQVLANPEVNPQTIARDLSSALAGTPLRGKAVEWSADRYSAAHVSENHHRFGALRGVNVVPIGPLMSGLRRAGLTPHLLLRVTTHGLTSSLPASRYGTRAFRWYDARQIGSQGSVTVTARMTWISLARILAYYLAPPLVCLLGMWLAGFVSGRTSLEDAVRRSLFRRIGSYAVMGGFMAQVGGMVYLLRTPTPATLTDLWFGSGTTTELVPFLVAAAVPLALFFLLGRKQEIRRFGPAAAGPAIPMSDEEKAVRKRVAQWSMVPHLIGAAALGAVPLFVTRTSPLYPFIHPVAMFLPAVGAGLAARVFQKRLDRFTQKSLDDDLTWRARQFGQTMGVRMPDVFVEDSSRAAHLAFASRQGHHITLSRKLQATFTAAETGFVMAHHLACMKRRTGISGSSLLMGLVLPMPMLIPAILILSPRFIPGIPTTATLFLSPWFLPAVLAYMPLCGMLIVLAVRSSARGQAKQETDADRDALEATGDLTAAENALDKLGADAALSSEAQAAAQFSGSFAGSAGKNTAQMAAGRLALRRAVLRQTEATLRFAPGTKSAAPDLSPFSSSDADRRTL